MAEAHRLQQHRGGVGPEAAQAPTVAVLLGQYYYLVQEVGLV